MQSLHRLFLCSLVISSILFGGSAVWADGPNRAAQEQIQALHAELADLRWIEQWGNWPTVATSKILEVGAHEPAITALRKRLILSGDLESIHAQPEGSVEAQTYDEALLQAVYRFQSRHGLEPDGVVGGVTLRALNVSVEQRIRQIELNLARWERLQNELEDDFILVNIPEYTLRLYDDARVRLDMRVVVGKTSRPTPEMTEQLEYLVVNPYWYVPKRIGAYEILPKVQKDPEYLGRGRYEVWQGNQRLEATSVAWENVSAENFDYSFRQRPGSGNSLGQIKFILPNSSNIYLHDTPSRTHFAKARRAYSHGCVRLEEPYRLARAVLEMQTDLQQSEIQEKLGLDYTTRLELDEHLPVHLVYLTAWSHEGVVHYFNDVYKRDRKSLEQALPAEVPAPRTYTAGVAPTMDPQLASHSAVPKKPTSSKVPSELTWSALPASGH